MNDSAEHDFKAFRFRSDRDPRATDQAHRRWQARYSHPGGWATFDLSVDLAGGACTFHRVKGTDYSALLADLTRSLMGPGARLPRTSEPVERIALETTVVGLKMARGTGSVRDLGGDSAHAGPFRADPSGEWLVVRAFVPDGSESFLLAVSDRLGAAEIVVPSTEAGAAALRTLGPVFT